MSKTINEIQRIKEDTLKSFGNRIGEDDNRIYIMTCCGTGCTSSGSQKIIEALERELEKNGLTDEVAVVKTGCHGLCAAGPIMVVYPEACFYSMVQEDDIPEIVSEHLLESSRIFENEPMNRSSRCL